MKQAHSYFWPIMAGYLPVHSQDVKDPLPAGTAVAPPAGRILGNIPDATPPKFIVRAKDVLEPKSVEQGGLTITVRKINPIALPPPVESLSPEARAAFPEKVAQYRTNHPRPQMTFRRATVFRSKESPPRTLVRCWPEGKRETITFWSSAAFGLISGIHSFVDSTGSIHAVLMGGVM